MKLLQPFPDRPHFPFLLYLPGLDGTGQLFYRQAASLSTCFNLRYLSLPPHPLTDWPLLSQQVLDLWYEEQSGAPLVLCGESFGGCLALSLASQAVSQVEQLILVNPASSFRLAPWLSWGIPLAPWLPDLLYSLGTWAFLPWLAQLERLTAYDQQRLRQAMATLSPAMVSQRLALLQTFALSAFQLSQITQPTLILASEGDRLLPSVQEAAFLQKHLPQAVIHPLPDSGHACLLETSLDLGAILRRYDLLPKVLSGVG
ncbi:alpha/beta hydrolase [Synechocystis sp. LKSZ1]|uniref:alpha/beta fold hydrolase n=1 Tax=Synechocystis sp. LKSZ1 TaxID=3144951 RepID=UPI00336BF9D3